MSFSLKSKLFALGGSSMLGVAVLGMTSELVLTRRLTLYSLITTVTVYSMKMKQLIEILPDTV